MSTLEISLVCLVLATLVGVVGLNLFQSRRARGTATPADEGPLADPAPMQRMAARDRVEPMLSDLDAFDGPLDEAREARAQAAVQPHDGVPMPCPDDALAGASAFPPGTPAPARSASELPTGAANPRDTASDRP